MSDAVTRAECGLSDPEAFGAFYDEALPLVYRYLLARCGRLPEVAEDLTQETFLAAVAEIKRGARVASPLAWVFGIARHRLADHFRRQERDERKLALAFAAAPNDTEQADWVLMGSREQAVVALRAVPPMQRVALGFRYLDDLPVPEVARLLGKSVHATESLLARGRENFKRAYMGGEG